jgi:hypothetical protein
MTQAHQFMGRLSATAGMPQPVLDRPNHELVQIVRSPGYAARVEPLGFECAQRRWTFRRAPAGIL